MDLATLLGLIGAFAIVILAMLLGGSVLIFINVPSILVVVVPHQHTNTFALRIAFSLIYWKQSFFHTGLLQVAVN